MLVRVAPVVCANGKLYDVGHALELETVNELQSMDLDVGGR